MASQRSWQGLDLRGYRRSRCLLIFFVFLALPLSATTYYVDNCVTVGSDSNNGTSPSTAWLTLTPVNALTSSTLPPGSSVLFQSTCTWRGQLSPPSSGSNGSQITFGKYGTGADPVINGSGLISGWTLYSGNVWEAPITSYTGTPQKVWFNNALGTAVGSIVAVTGTNDWFFTSNVLYAYSTSNPSTAFTSPGIEAAIFDGIYITTSYITINGIDTTKSNVGVQVNATAALSGVNVYNGNHSNEGTNGISYTSYSGHFISGGIIQGNVASANGGAGIEVIDSDGITVQHNTTYSNGALAAGVAGLYEYEAAAGDPNGGNVWQYNTSYSNVETGGTGGQGIHLDQVYGGEIVRYNRLYNNATQGVLIEANHAPSDAVGPEVYYNVVPGNSAQGIFIENRSGGDTTGATFKASHVYNNVVYGNLYGILVDGEAGGTCKNNVVRNNISEGNTNYQLMVYGGGENDGTNGSGNVYTYNAFGTAASNFIEWGSGVYESTYAAFDSAYGSASYSITTAPTFTNASGGNFTLASGSSAISSGTNLGATYQYALSPTASWPSSVTLFQQGLDGTWDIGAYSITVTGNIISSAYNIGAYGHILLTPAATNYILTPKDSSYTLGTIDTHATEMPTNPGAANVNSGVNYGSFTGTLVGGGGGGVCAIVD
jgi:parallel beta-helix repeat protein